MLALDHPAHGVKHKHFSFISDRQKGLSQALKEVFPENYAMFCAVHITRNIETNPGMGKKDSQYVLPLAKTFSPRLYQELMSKLTAAAQRYLKRIPKEQWRNTAWMEDPSLPPRYGVRTSNMSESTNSMFGNSKRC
jgi:transposase-like protein